MNKEDYRRAWGSAAQSGTLLTSKHDPGELSTPHGSYRTVTCMSAVDIEKYVATGDFSIRVFTNHDSKHSSKYCELIPRDPSIVAGSGVPAMSTTPTVNCDRFVVVSGTQQGWHIFAESSATIKGREQAGKLTLTTELL